MWNIWYLRNKAGGHLASASIFLETVDWWSQLCGQSIKLRILSLKLVTFSSCLPHTMKHAVLRVKYTRTHTHACTHMHTHAHTRMHVRTRTHTHTRAHARTHTYARAHVHTHTHAHAHTHTRMHAHTHTHTHSRPATSFLWFTSPWKTFKHIIWRHYKWYIIGSIVVLFLVVIIAIFIYTSPVSHTSYLCHVTGQVTCHVDQHVTSM